jgi:hypothetical protein
VEAAWWRSTLLVIGVMEAHRGGGGLWRPVGATLSGGGRSGTGLSGEAGVIELMEVEVRVGIVQLVAPGVEPGAATASGRGGCNRAVATQGAMGGSDCGMRGRGGGTKKKETRRD